MRFDRELCLPQTSWCADRERCAEAGIGEDVAFATKPGDNPGLRAWLQDRDLNYVMAVVLDPGADEHVLLVRRLISKPTELATTSAAPATRSRSPNSWSISVCTS
jgi:hypothetical protein